MRLLPSVFLAAAMLGGCTQTGYLLDHTIPTKTAFVTPQLARYGFSQREAQCVAGRMAASLSIWQLRQFREAAAAAHPAGSATPPSKGDFWAMASRIPDAETPGEVMRAIEACAVAADAAPAQIPTPSAPSADSQRAEPSLPPGKIQNGPRDYEPSAQLLSALDAYDRDDFAAAARLARSAADAGDSGAQQFLGGLYSAGRGVAPDLAEAARYYRLAAEQGWSEAMNNLGKAYEAGLGVPRDVVEASKWYLLASARATEDEQMVERNRKALLGTMTLEQIEKAADLARQWEAARR